jgi:acyl dehydratase
MRYPEILAIPPKRAEFAYDANFTALYALGVGAGADERDLPLVYERGLQTLPTMAVIMATASGEFIREGAIDARMIVHGEQRLTVHKPLPPAGKMATTSRCLSIVDKGEAKGALVNIECAIADADSGEAHATSTITLFCRGDGGFGGPSDGDLPLHPAPDRPHDIEIALPTLPQQAALYRLLGDLNPLHIDPAFAQKAGFPRPILHGLCTYGIASRAIIRACCDDDPSRIERFDVRFSAPVFPGETLTTRIWRDGSEIAFECFVAERDAKVVRNGYCTLRG